MRKKILIACAVAVSLLTGWVLLDIRRNSQIQMSRSRPADGKPIHVDRILLDLEQGKSVDWVDLEGAIEFINGRYDCSDFRLQSLTRIVYNHWDKVDPDTRNLIRDCFLGFKYWMDQPGSDGMCFWSENHQILFSASEFLAGQRWPDEIFTNTGRLGREHQVMARKRILTWLEQRWLYGFTEWYSNVYYVEDIAPLSNLIEFAEDEEIVTKAMMILDLLLHDLATQSYRGTFISTSGRLYQGNKFDGGGNSMKGVIGHIWDTERWGYQHGPSRGMDLNFILLDGYRVPDVIKEIGEDESAAVIRASSGLNVRELEEEGLCGQEDPQIMMQWAMESFSNPETIANSVKYINRNGMLTNQFLHPFKIVNIGLLKTLNLLPAASRELNPVTNGTAIQRANTYTYRTADYMLATAQAYHPGTYGDQHHVWNATISDGLSIFTTHPAYPIVVEGVKGNSPGYWVGSGRLPHAVQDRNTVLIVYNIPEEPGFLEADLYDYTHAHFPKDAMDETIIDGRYAFGREGNALFAFIARNELSYKDDSDHDLIQQGKDSYWIFEVSTSEEEGSLENFVQRIKGNPVNYEDDCLTYQTNSRSLELTYRGVFEVDGTHIETEHLRFDSPYSQTKRKPKTITIAHAGKSLFLDFYNGIREEREIQGQTTN